MIRNIWHFVIVILALKSASKVTLPLFLTDFFNIQKDERLGMFCGIILNVT